MDYLTMKSDEKAIQLEKEGSDDPSFFINYSLEERCPLQPLFLAQNESRTSQLV